MGEHITVRIPELPSQSLLSLADKLPVWVADDNKTRHASLQDLRTLIMTGGTGSHAPVYNGGKIIYKVPLDTPPETQIASIPSIAGKDFFLRREGRPLIPQEDPEREDAEFEVLDGGGFKLLLDEDYLIPGERFELDVFSLQGGAPAPGPGAGSSLITGVVPITVNTTLNPTDHLNKLIQLRAGSSQVTVTLMDVDDVPDNTIVVIESSILNTYQNKIQTQGGQFIYMRNQSPTYLYMGIGEALWLLRLDDGWYVLNDFGQIYDRIGKVEASYKVGLNEVVGDGSLLSRAQHPRLWEFALATGGSIVPDSIWQIESVALGGKTIPRPYRGCYSTGDGTTTFRVPDLMNMALRGLKTIGGGDSERYKNDAGGFQLNELLSHGHNVPIPASKTSQDQEGTGNVVGGGAAPEPAALVSLVTDAYGGTETRMDNIGIIWTIKE